MAEPNAARFVSIFPLHPNDTQSLIHFSCSLEAMAAAAVQEAIKQGKREAERFVTNFLYVKCYPEQC
jgi:hypothetical protein